MEAVIYNLPRSYEILKDVPGEQRNADLPLGNRLQWLDCGSPQNLVQAKNRMEELGKYSNTQKKAYQVTNAQKAREHVAVSIVC